MISSQERRPTENKDFLCLTSIKKTKKKNFTALWGQRQFLAEVRQCQQSFHLADKDVALTLVHTANFVFKLSSKHGSIKL